MTQFTTDTNGKPLTVTIPIATLEHLVVALEKSVGAMQGLYGGWRCTKELKMANLAITAGRAALANAEPTGFSLTNTSISDTSRTIESFFEAMDKEVAAGRLVRTGPMEWTKL